VDVDPRTNVVVFQLNNADGEILVGRAPTLAEDGVRQAWEGTSREHGAQPGQVAALHSEWEPSPADMAFIDATFADVTVTFNFSRPEPDGWEEAFAAASAAMFDANDGDSRPEAEQTDSQLLPVLWSESSSQARMLEAVPHWPVAAGRLHLALAVVAPTPRGTIGMHHVTHHQLGNQSFDELMAAACGNLSADLRVNGHETDDGVLMSLSGTLVSATVCLPDFYQRLSELTGAERLVVGLPCPDEVYVAAADSPLADVIHRAVHESEYPNTELVPTVLSVAGDRIEVLSERG
jgi:hypothetical protein